MNRVFANYQRSMASRWRRIYRALLMILLIAGMVTTSMTPAQAATGEHYVGALTTVRGQAWLPGPTGAVDGNLWVADAVRGVCRIDLDAGGQFVLNPATCSTVAAAPGQFAFANNFVYVPASANGSTSLVRLSYDPVTESLSAPTAINLAPGVTPAPNLRPAAAAISPGGSVYVGALNSNVVVRIVAPGSASPIVQTVGTASSSGVRALAFVGGNLYLAENGVVTRIANADTCTGACTATPVTGITVAAPLSLVADPSHLYIGATDGVYRYNPTTGVQELFGDTGSVVVAGNTLNPPLVNVTSLAIDGANLYAADDPTGGINLHARIWRLLTTDPAGGDPTTALTVATLYAERPGAGITLPASLHWLGGALGERLWVTDVFQGLCRVDPAIGGPALNLATCRIGADVPGQVAVDYVNNLVYMPVAEDGLHRAQYNPATNTIGTPVRIMTEAGRVRLTAAALGPDGNLYFGSIRIPDIQRFVNPSGDPAGPPQQFHTIGLAGGEVSGMAFVGNDLYILDVEPVSLAPRLAVIPNAVGCGGAPGLPGNCVAQTVPGVTLSAADVHFSLTSDGVNLFVANETELLWFNPATGVATPLVRSGIDGLGNNSPFRSISGVGIDSQGQVFFGDDTTAAEGAGETRIWQVERPIANAGVDQTVLVNSTVTLDGTGSSDPASHLPLTYAWTQTGGPAVTLTGANTTQPTFTAPATPAVLTFALIVNDGIGLASTADSVQVTVNDAPITGLTLNSTSSTTLGQTTPFTVSTTGGANITYVWNFGDGSAEVSGGSANSHVYPTAGIFTAIVTATNNAGSVSAQRVVTITNQPPTANAGSGQTVTVGANVTLNASASSDPDGHTPLSYGWQQTGGAPVTLSNAAAAQPTFTAPAAPSTLTFSVIVTDSRGLPANAVSSVVVNVRDTAISNAALSSNGPTTLGAATTLTATATGSNLTYLWNFGDGTPLTPSGATVTHVFPVEGNFAPSVVIANSFMSVTRSTPVNITNLAPLANAGADQNVLVGSVVNLNSQGSSDPDGHTPLSHSWVQTGGPAVVLTGANTATPSFTAPAAPTTLTFALTVADARGKASNGADQVVITVGDAPITNLAVTHNGPVVVGQTVNYTATAAGSNIVYHWSFGDGATGAGATPNHTYSSGGLYTVIVTATNGAGSATATALIGVGYLPPTAEAGAAQNAAVGAAVTLDGSGSSDPGNNTPLLYRWTQIGGPTVVLSNPAAAQPIFSAPATPATLTFRLMVTNTVGLSSTPDDTTVTVLDIPVGGLTVNNNSPTVLGQPTQLSANATGSNIVYTWRFGDGATANGKNVSHTYSGVGAFTAIVTATNSAGSASASTIVLVTNQPPIANAGPNQQALVDDIVTLNGSGSSDPDGHTPLVYGWRQTDGPTVSLSNAAAAQPTFTAPAAPTSLTFSLIVTDSRGFVSAADEVTVQVRDRAPGALSANNSGPTTLGQATTLSASAQGSNLAFQWNPGDGSPVKDGASVSHTYAAAGAYQATVTATNSAGHVSATTIVVVHNTPPLANAGADKNALVGENVVLDASASSDPDNHLPLSVGWQQIGGPSVVLINADKAQASFTTPPTPTTLTFRLIVTDAHGLAGVADTVDVVVSDAPVANLTAASNAPTTLGAQTTLSASANGSNLSYAWELGDGNTASGANVTHVYAAAGVYTARVTATNAAGSQSATILVTVTNLRPTIVTGGNQSVKVNQPVILDASASNDPEDHEPLTFLWEQISGAAVTLSNPTNAIASFTAPGAAGALIFRVTVTDARGLANTAQVIVNVDDVPISNLEVTTNSPTVFGAATTLVANAIGSNITYEWTLGDGTPNKTGAVVQHTYAAPGVYTVLVVATNNLGGATRSATIEVVNPRPVVTGAVLDPPPTLGQVSYTLTITGSNFVPGALVYWNNTPRATTFISATELKAVIVGGDVNSASIARIHVNNPAPGGGSSEQFVINLPAPIDPNPEEPGGNNAATLYLPVVTR